MPRPTLTIPDGSPIDEVDEASAEQGLMFVLLPPSAFSLPSFPSLALQSPRIPSRSRRHALSSCADSHPFLLSFRVLFFSTAPEHRARITGSPAPMEPATPAGRRRSSTIRSTMGRPRAPSAASAHSHGRASLPRRPSVGRSRGESYVALEQHSDPLDQHVVDVLTKKQKRKRALIGVWEFLKTPFGICVAL